MIFNSFEFLLFFLPVVYVGFVIIHRVGGWSAVFPYLAAASLVFYAHFSIMLASVLAASVVFNFTVGGALLELRERRRFATLLLLVSVSANIAILGYYKYSNFLIESINAASGAGFSTLDLILPVGISFYTFIQIGYLVEAYNGTAEKTSFDRYDAEMRVEDERCRRQSAPSPSLGRPCTVFPERHQRTPG